MSQAPTSIMHQKIYWKASDENSSSWEQMRNYVEQAYIEAAEEVLGERKPKKR